MEIAQVLAQYQPLDGWRANFVVSIDGVFKDINGSSRGVSTSQDRELLIHLRRISDVVLVSAKSAKAEALHSTKLSTLAIVSSGGDLSGIPALHESQNSVLVIVPARTDLATDVPETASIVRVENAIVGRIAPLELKGAIAALDFKRSLVEFGPDWLRQLVLGGCIDELCLSVTKKEHEFFDSETANHALEKLGLADKLVLMAAYECEDTLFTRWKQPRS